MKQSAKSHYSMVSPKTKRAKERSWAEACMDMGAQGTQKALQGTDGFCGMQFANPCFRWQMVALA